MNNGLIGYPQRNALASVTAASTNATRAGFTSSGTWTVPAGVTQAVLHIISAAASGGGSNTNQGGGGGNGGNYLAVRCDLTPGEVLTISIGLGGTASSAGGVAGVRGGDTQVTRANGTVLAYCPGGLSNSLTSWWDRPPANPDLYIANGTLVAWVRGGRGGRGHTSVAYGGGGGGGGGFGMGLGITPTDGTPQVDVNASGYGVGGLGSVGTLSTPAAYGAGVAPPITLSPESGSGGSNTTGAGSAGARGAGGSGGCGNCASGPGGNGYALIEY